VKTNVNAKSESYEADVQEYWANWLITLFLHSLT